MKSYVAALLWCLSLPLFAAPTWEEHEPIPIAGRPNPFSLDDKRLAASIESGKTMALHYPVGVTGILMPFRPIKDLMEMTDSHPLKSTFLRRFRVKRPMHSMDDLFAWLGLFPYPAQPGKGPYGVPFGEGKRPAHRMGVTVANRFGAEGVTFSCASCHLGHLFGRPVFGLTTRFPRANEFFSSAKASVGQVPAFAFQLALGTSNAEYDLYAQARANLAFVDSKLPQSLGLDTSLAHTALSLARRAPDAFASKESYYASHPRPDAISTYISDSKPSVWWNLKYKNRWLSDGSVVSGNPILTNFLWNEIGRGTDLNELFSWLENNEAKVQSLTTAVFASEPPRYFDFFPATEAHLARAKRGEVIFNQACRHCHGHYEKAWQSAVPHSIAESMRTVRVTYHASTPVLDVGTDPLRFRAMTSLAPALNRLEISRRNGIVVVPQQGYVPPPLDGIWARWPYFHNNSAPSLCAVLTRAEQRPTRYFAGEARDPSRDFDQSCNGYPMGKDVPLNWQRDEETAFDGTKPGLRPMGHDQGIFVDGELERYTPEQKQDLIAFLQTL